MSDEQASIDGAEHRDYGGPMPEQGPLGSLINPMSGLYEALNTAYRRDQFAKLRKEQQMRSDAPMSDQNYAGYSHENLHAMVNDNLDTETANTAGDIVNEIGNWLSDVSAAMRNAVKQEQVEWQGEAASKAHDLFRANATWGEDTRDAAWLVSNRYKEQAETAAKARSQMPEPTHFDMKDEMTKGFTKIAQGDFSDAADVFSSIPDKQQEAEEKHAEAVQVMQNMDSGYYQTASTQPMFAKPPEPGDSSSAGTSTASYIPGSDGSGGVTSPGRPGGGVTGGSGPVSAGAGTSGGSTLSGAPGTTGRSYSGTGPMPSTSPTENTGTTSTPSYGGSSPRAGAAGAAAAPLAGGGNLRNAGSDTPRSGLGRGSGASRAGGSSAAPRATGGSAGAGERAAAGRATGSEPGGSKGPVARGGATAARAAESSTHSGRPMAGAPGGRGGGNDDEEEHQRKYEFGEDPDEIFGDDAEYTEDGQRIVPPVIGG